MRRWLLLIIICSLVHFALAQKIVIKPIDTTENIIFVESYRYPSFAGDVFSVINEKVIFPISVFQNVKGRMIVSFVVGKNGALKNFIVKQSVGSAVDSAIINVLQQTVFIPAAIDGVRYNIEVATSLHLDVLVDAKRKTIAVSRHVYKNNKRTVRDKQIASEPPYLIYPSVIDLFRSYLRKHLKYPKAAMGSKQYSAIILELLINKRGKISEIHFDGEPPKLFKDEIISVVSRYSFEQEFIPYNEKKIKVILIFDWNHSDDVKVFLPNLY